MSNSPTPSLFHITLFIFLAGIIYSCGGSKHQAGPGENTPTIVVFDTIQKARIDSTVKNINGQLNATDGPKRIPYPLHNKKDELLIWEVKDDAARISIEWNLPNEVIWPTFFINKGELIFVRYRYYINEPPSNIRVFESMIYLHNGDIIYCEERGMPLLEGEIPGLLRMKEYSRSTRSYTEIAKDYTEHWKTVKAFMKEKDVLPSYIKE